MTTFDEIWKARCYICNYADRDAGVPNTPVPGGESCFESRYSRPKEKAEYALHLKKEHADLWATIEKKKVLILHDFSADKDLKHSVGPEWVSRIAIALGVASFKDGPLVLTTEGYYDPREVFELGDNTASDDVEKVVANYLRIVKEKKSQLDSAHWSLKYAIQVGNEEIKKALERGQADDKIVLAYPNRALTAQMKEEEDKEGDE